MNRKTQRAAILRLLLDAKGGWVPLPEIMRCAAQYNSRIFELRRLGFTVENRTERDGSGNVLSWYRLVPGVPSEAHQPSTALPDPAPATESDSTEWLPF
jgi:hypothetical protein